jgi:hypothetical protein
MVIRGRQRNDLIQVLALDPQLVLAGCIAGILTAFEHGNDNNLDAEGLTWWSGLGKKQAGARSEDHQRANELFKDFAHEIPLPLDLPDMLCFARMKLYITGRTHKNPIVPRPILWFRDSWRKPV